MTVTVLFAYGLYYFLKIDSWKWGQWMKMYVKILIPVTVLPTRGIDLSSHHQSGVGGDYFPFLLDDNWYIKVLLIFLNNTRSLFLFIGLHWVLVTACGIFSSCGL